MPDDAAAHEALIDRLYAGLDAGDGEAMARCYAPDASFEDPAFGALGPGRVRDMWRMLCAQGGGGLTARVVERRADADGTGTARWQADYTFTETGRPVHNDVRASFVFGDGLIVAHRDVFDLRAWAGQALGPGPAVLGFTPLLGVVVRRRARGRLDAFRAGGGAR